MRTETSRRAHSVAWVVLIAACLALTFPLAASANCSAATQKASSLGKQVTDVVANTGLATGDRLSRFRSIFRNNADFPTMARFALGKYWKSLPSSQRGEYFDLVENLVVKVLFGQLETYAGQRYSITTDRCLPKGSKGREFYVEGSVLNAAGQKTTDVKWWFLSRGGDMKLFDFQVAGIWLTQQKRAEFTSFLQTRRGDINALLDDLRRRTGA